MTKIFQIFAASLLLSLASCQNYGKEYDVYIDPAFAHDTDVILSGLDDWQNKTGVRFNVQIGIASDDKEHQIHIIRYDHYSIFRMSGKDTARAFTSRNTGSDSSYVRLQGDMFADLTEIDGLVRHEIGHALGLQHSNPGTVMCANMDCDAPVVTKYDVLQYHELRD